MKPPLAFLALLAIWPAWAQDPTAPAAPPPGEDWAALRAQAGELHARASALRKAGDETQAAADLACREKIFVSACVDDARKARQETERAAQDIDQQAVAIEKRLRYHEHDLKLQRRADKEAAQQAEAAQRAEAIRQQDEQRRLRLERKQAEEARRKERAARVQ